MGIRNTGKTESTVDNRKNNIMAPLNFLLDPWHFGVDPDTDLDPRIHASD
jgi:hypothetical protein